MDFQANTQRFRYVPLLFLTLGSGPDEVEHRCIDAVQYRDDCHHANCISSIKFET